MSGLRVLVVASFDSFLRAGAAWGRRLEADGATVEYALVFARLGQISPEQQRALGFDAPLQPRSIESVTSADYLRDFDVVIVSLNGLRTRRFMTRFSRLWSRRDRKRPIAVGLYPGVVFRFHLEGMMSRMSCDAVLLNSPSDCRLYGELCASLGVEDNSVCAGLLFLDEEPRSRAERSPDGEIVFAGQPTVPSGRHERLYVVEQLVGLARRFPDQRVVLKPRHRPRETTLHKVKYHYEELLERSLAGAPLPANLAVSYAPMAQVLDTAKLCLTFSSTAGLEAIVRGVPTRFLTDLGINENIGNHYFMGSGALCDFADVVPDMAAAVDARWLADHAAAAGEGAGRVAARIEELLERQRAAGAALPPPSGRLFGRAPSFTRFVESTMNWPALEQFGDDGKGLGRLGRVRRLWAPVQRAILNRARR